MSRDSAWSRHYQEPWAPLPPGFGMTLGNAMRRVLLSSLPGAACPDTAPEESPGTPMAAKEWTWYQVSPSTQDGVSRSIVMYRQ